MQAIGQDHCILTALPDELFLKVVSKLITGDEAPGTPATGPPTVRISI